eukprot:scaffold1063_cov318-Pavlova_lutheri.AAC.1
MEPADRIRRRFLAAKSTSSYIFSATIQTGSASARMCVSSCDTRWTLRLTITEPNEAAAKCSSITSARFLVMTATRSPPPTPRFSNILLHPAIRWRSSFISQHRFSSLSHSTTTTFASFPSAMLVPSPSRPSASASRTSLACFSSSLVRVSFVFAPLLSGAARVRA